MYSLLPRSPGSAARKCTECLSAVPPTHCKQTWVLHLVWSVCCFTVREVQLLLQWPGQTVCPKQRAVWLDQQHVSRIHQQNWSQQLNELLRCCTDEDTPKRDVYCCITVLTLSGLLEELLKSLLRCYLRSKPVSLHDNEWHNWIQHFRWSWVVYQGCRYLCYYRLCREAIQLLQRCWVSQFALKSDRFNVWRRWVQCNQVADISWRPEPESRQISISNEVLL